LYLVELLPWRCRLPDREVGDVAGGRESDIGTDERQELDCVGQEICSAMPPRRLNWSIFATVVASSAGFAFGPAFGATNPKVDEMYAKADLWSGTNDDRGAAAERRLTYSTTSGIS
jgi:hypothetical protein